MICPNCGSNMSDKKRRCDRCGTDLSLYQKVIRTSNLYYNNGLARAQVRDLSGAIIALRKSLELNKSNTNARNLLGLVYYEMGETVAALSEWVISKHLQPDKNDADEYINKLQSNLTRLDALNQAIKRYNTALGLAKQGSDDLAIIQLKKVVNLNANFIRAYQLLSLLLLKTGDTDKAKRFLARAARIDVTNTTTLRYMQQLEAPTAQLRDIDSGPESEQGQNSAIRPISSYREDKPNVIAFVNLVIGIAIGLAVMAVLVIPTIKKNNTSEDSSDYTDSGYTLTQIQAKDDTITGLETENAELKQQIEQLNTKIDNIVIPEDTAAVYAPLLNAAQLYYTELAKPVGERNLLPIADLLSEITDSELEIEASITLLEQLKAEVYPTAAEYYYDEGHGLYSDGKYEEALVKLEKAIIFDPTDVDAVYFTARSYHRLGDKENAALYYNLVITDYPDSARVSDAKDFLKEVQSN